MIRRAEIIVASFRGSMVVSLKRNAFPEQGVSSYGVRLGSNENTGIKSCGMQRLRNGYQVQYEIMITTAPLRLY